MGTLFQRNHGSAGLVDHGFCDARSSRIADQSGFVVDPRRWVVERTFAWLNRNRCLAKNFEATIAFLYAAAAMLLTRRLARSK